MLDLEEGPIGSAWELETHILDNNNDLDAEGVYVRVLADFGPISGPLSKTGGTLANFRDLTTASADTGWVPIVGFPNGWDNLGGEEPASARRDANGWVELRGIIASGLLDVPALNLGEGFRPVHIGGATSGPLFPVVSNGAFGRVSVLANGDLYALSPSSACYVSLAGIRFPTT